MEQFSIQTRLQLCTAFDNDLGVQVEWIKGDFYGTQETTANRFAPWFAKLTDDEYLVALAITRDEIYKHVQATRPELL